MSLHFPSDRSSRVQHRLAASNPPSLALVFSRSWTINASLLTFTLPLPTTRHFEIMASDSQALDKTYLPFRGVQNDTSFYAALDPASRQIRYVDLHPGAADEPLVCSLGYTILDIDASE